MIRGATVVLSLVLVAANAPAQPPNGGPPPGPGRPPFEVFDFGPMVPGERVENAPFSAEGLTTMVRRLPDGNRIEHQLRSRLTRDSRGRTRREQPMPPLGPFGQSPDVTLVTITDPDKGLQYRLQPESRSAQQIPLPPPGSRPPRPPMPPGNRQPGGGRPEPEVRTESLGSKVISGVNADGTKTTMRIPAGAIGNVNPVDVVTERWYSPELGIVVASTRTDPVMGDSTFELTSLSRVEPATHLFEVPATYTVTTRQGPPGPPPVPR